MEQTVQLDFPELNPDNPEIERMWAFEKVERLMDQRRRGNRVSKLTQEIVRLCEGYSIVSEFASFIVLENDAEYARWSIERRNANRIQRDRAAQTRLRKELEKLRDEAVAQIGPADSKTVSANQSAPQSGPTPPSSNSSSPSSNSVTTPRDQTQPVPIDRTSRDLDIGFSNGGGHGGGAIDPITGFIAVSAAGAAAWARRRKDRMSK